MATARRAYTAEYQYGFTPEVQPERVRRTRQRPEVNGQQEVSVFHQPAEKPEHFAGKRDRKP